MLLGVEGRAIDEDRVGEAIDLVHEEGQDFLLLAAGELALIDDMDVSILELSYQLSEGLVEELGVFSIESEDGAEGLLRFLALGRGELFRRVDEATQ